MSDDNRLIGIAWENRKLLNNWNVVSNKNLLFILSSEILLASLIVIGDYYIFDSTTIISFINSNIGVSQRLARALMDNLSHMVVGVISWTIISYSQISIYEIIGAAFFSSIIDIDHFISARSLKLGDAISLANRPFLHNSLTLLLVNIFIFVLLSLLNSNKKVNWSLLLFISWFSHHIRDANRRGMWFGSVLTTKPIKDDWYLMIILFMPLVIRFFYQNEINLFYNFFSRNNNNQTKVISHIV